MVYSLRSKALAVAPYDQPGIIASSKINDKLFLDPDTKDLNVKTKQSTAVAFLALIMENALKYQTDFFAPAPRYFVIILHSFYCFAE